MTQQPQRVPLSDLFSLSGQVAIVTGGGMGIGHGIVLRLAEAGADIVIADLKLEAAERVAAEVRQMGRRALALQCDVAEESQVVEVVKRAAGELGRVDVLVNNAGIFPFKPALEMTAQEWDRVQNVNLRGTFLFSREFVNELRREDHEGVVVNIGSIDSIHPYAVGLAAYDASKGGMLMFNKNFALEAAQYGVRVNMIAPGGIATEGAAAGSIGLPPETLEAMRKQTLARIPLGRMGVPDDIAIVALFLATPASAYMTGETVVVDGGRLLS
jgi:NAD(P)-dependent dehydrogenase (short-subunit alcohol dehydrogenase family)